MRRGLLAAGAVAVTVLAAGCASSAASSGSGSNSGSSAAPVTLRLGFLANITHAPALVAVYKGFFTQSLGKNVTLSVKTFSSGTEQPTPILPLHLYVPSLTPHPAPHPS